jgi:hypothetical protein
MNTNENAVQKVETDDRSIGDAAREAAVRLIGSVVEGAANLTIGILAASVEEYNRREAEKKQAKKDQCVALIEKALMSGERVSRKELYEIIPSLEYFSSRAEIATYLGVSIEEFNAGVKRWYHLF